MTFVLLTVALLVTALVVLAATGGLSVRRYSATHVVAQLAFSGRGLYFQPHPGRGLVAIPAAPVPANVRGPQRVGRGTAPRRRP